MQNINMVLFRGLALVALLFGSAHSFASTQDIECKKANDTLTMAVGTHKGEGPTLYYIRLNGLVSPEADALFRQLIDAPETCADLAMYVKVDQNKVRLCDGEMFAPNGVYGQVILSSGAIEVFKDSIAPTSGWKCN